MPGLAKIKKATLQHRTESAALVDGKEFLAKTLKMATRNLPWSPLIKYRYDKLSDAAQLTALDDGNSEKTINLKLKEDKKKGVHLESSRPVQMIGTKGGSNVNSSKEHVSYQYCKGNNTNTEGFSF